MFSGEALRCLPARLPVLLTRQHPPVWATPRLRANPARPPRKATSFLTQPPVLGPPLDAACTSTRLAARAQSGLCETSPVRLQMLSPLPPKSSAPAPPYAFVATAPSWRSTSPGGPFQTSWQKGTL